MITFIQSEYLLLWVLLWYAVTVALPIGYIWSLARTERKISDNNEPGSFEELAVLPATFGHFLFLLIPLSGLLWFYIQMPNILELRRLIRAYPETQRHLAENPHLEVQKSILSLASDIRETYDNFYYMLPGRIAESFKDTTKLYDSFYIACRKTNDFVYDEQFIKLINKSEKPFAHLRSLFDEDYTIFIKTNNSVYPKVVEIIEAFIVQADAIYEEIESKHRSNNKEHLALEEERLLKDLSVVSDEYTKELQESFAQFHLTK